MEYTQGPARKEEMGYSVSQMGMDGKNCTAEDPGGKKRLIDAFDQAVKTVS